MAALSTHEKARRRAIRDARTLIQQAEKADANEAETRRRIERMFETIMGYDPFVHLSRERSVRGAGETEHVDFAIQLESGEDARPVVMVEIKRVAVDLATKHLKQVTSYAIDAGCEWALLTNGREWKLYHVEFGKPPVTKEVRRWNLSTDDVADLSDDFELLSLRNLRKDALAALWQKTSVLLPENLLAAIVCEETLGSIRRQLRKSSGVLLAPDEIVTGFRKLLNESSANRLRDLEIVLPKKKARKRRSASKEDVPDAGGDRQASTDPDAPDDSPADATAAPDRPARISNHSE